MLRRKVLLATLLISIVLSSCAALKITTWIIKEGVLVHGADNKTIVEAEGYRCYSLPDDSAWREELKIQRACCAGSRQ